MERMFESYREMVLFHNCDSGYLSIMLRNGIGEPNERETMQKYFNKFYVFARDGKLQDFQELGKLIDSCREIIDRYTIDGQIKL